MSSHPTEFQGSVIDALREAIERQIPDSRAEVNGGGGHYTIEVISPGSLPPAAVARLTLVVFRLLDSVSAPMPWVRMPRLSMHR